MPDGRFLWYYWQVRALLDDQAVLLDTDHPDYQICEPEVSTHPHHLHRGAVPSRGRKDKVYALDIRRVDFPTILAKIAAQYLSA